jgi:hypothetical protein
VDVSFLLGNNVCCNCIQKDSFEMSKLRTYIENESCSTSIDSISVDTGITVKNLNRYLENAEFSTLQDKLNINL